MDKPFPAYTGNEPYIFVSYAHADDDLVYTEIQWLHDQGFNVWYDEGLFPGTSWRSELAEKIDGSSLFLFLVTPQSVVSDHCEREVNYAVDHGKGLVTVHLVATDMPAGLDLTLGTIQAILRYELSEHEYRKKLIIAVSEHIQRGVAAPLARQQRKSARPGAWVVMTLVFGIAIGATLMYWLPTLQEHPSKPAKTLPETIVRAPLPLDGWEDYRLDATFKLSLTMSHDGAFVTYVVRDEGGIPRLKYRRLDSLESVEIDGTEGGVMPFLSPDSRWLGFLVGKEIKRVPVEGGMPSTITTLEKEVWGASWGLDDRIVYAEGRSGLKSVSASGGKSQKITELDHTLFQGSHRLPHHLTTAPILLYCVFLDSGEKAYQHEIWALNLETGETKYLTDGVAPRYVSSGHVIYARPESGTRGSLWAAGFDLDSMQLTSTPVALQSGVAGRGGSAFSVGSRSAALVYMPDQGAVSTQVILREPDGSERTIGTGRVLDFPAISNAGDAVAFGGWNYGGNEDTIRIFRLNSGAVNRIARGSIPLWGPDDKTMTYSVHGKGIVRQRLDGDDSQEMLVPHSTNIFPMQWLDEGRTLLFHKVESGKVSSSEAYTLTNGESPIRIQRVASADAVSWDEHWIAYCTWPDGVYVADYPALRAITLVSESGCAAKWGRDDALLYYQDVNKLWSVDITFDNGVVLGQRRVIADLGLSGVELYDVHRTGRLVFVHQGYSDPKPPVVISGWQRVLKRSSE